MIPNTAGPLPLKVIPTRFPCEICGAQCDRPTICESCRALTPDEQQRLRDVEQRVAERKADDPARQMSVAGLFAEAERRGYTRIEEGR